MESRRITTSTALPSVHCAWTQLAHPFWAAPSSWQQQDWGRAWREATVARPWEPKQTHVHLQRRCAPEAWWVHRHKGHRLGGPHQGVKREVASARWPPALGPNTPLPHTSVPVLYPGISQTPLHLSLSLRVRKHHHCAVSASEAHLQATGWPPQGGLSPSVPSLLPQELRVRHNICRCA